MSIYERMSVTPSLTWLSQMLQMTNGEITTIPVLYKDQVKEIKGLLNNDVSGVVNTVLDFCLNSASVDFSIETTTTNTTEILNDWMQDINSDLRGKIPTGIKALAKEYFRERWKRGGLLVLRTIWETRDGYTLPIKMWFVDSEFVDVEGSKDGIRRLGEEQYKLIVSDKQKVNLPAKKDEMIFVQKPFGGWSDLQPTPFLIQRGLYKNMKMLSLLVNKGENLIANALEYLFMIKKGNERLALTENPDFIYSAEDLEKVKNDLQNFLTEKKSVSGTPIYATNFDTDISHLIPDYAKILNSELSSPIIHRILGGLGLIEIIEGTASTRKESLLNPKPMVQEIKSGIEDFKNLIKDVVATIIERNKGSHKKIFTDKMSLQIHNDPVTIFFDDNLRQLLRSMYDRGVISKRTFTEVVGDIDFDIEAQRRTIEKKEGFEELMFPPVVNNIDSQQAPIPTTTKTKNPNLENKNKTGPEKKNYKGMDSAEQNDYRYALLSNKNKEIELNQDVLEEATEIETLKEIETVKNLKNKNKLLKKLLKNEE